MNIMGCQASVESIFVIETFSQQNHADAAGGSCRSLCQQHAL